jgi:hypothetical protein
LAQAVVLGVLEYAVVVRAVVAGVLQGVDETAGEVTYVARLEEVVGECGLEVATAEALLALEGSGELPMADVLLPCMNAFEVDALLLLRRQRTDIAPAAVEVHVVTKAGFVGCRWEAGAYRYIRSQQAVVQERHQVAARSEDVESHFANWDGSFRPSSFVVEECDPSAQKACR